jgi:hypothetical protein
VSAHDALGAHRRLLSGALAAAADWLVAPVEPARGGADPAPLEARPVVAVLGLSPRCGATTVARALGAELGARDPGGACAVTATVPAGALALGFPAAGRLGRTLSPLARARVRPWGRLCLVEGPDRAALAAAARYLAPLVIDVDQGGEAPAAAALADHVVLVAAPDTEPALAAVVSASLAEPGPEPVTVLNRAPGQDGRWTGRAALELPESRAGAKLALAGREPRGALGAAVADLADACAGPT